MNDPVPPMNDPQTKANEPVPYVPQSSVSQAGSAGGQGWSHAVPAQPVPSGFNPRRVVHPDGMSRQEAEQAHVPAPYPAHPGWAGQTEQPQKKPSLLDRLMPKKAEAAPIKPSGPVKPFLAGFLFGVSLVLLIGHGWNDPEPVGPSWTLPTAPSSDASLSDSTANG